MRNLLFCFPAIKMCMQIKPLTTFFLLCVSSTLFAATSPSYEVIDEYIKNNKEIIKLPSGTAVAVIHGNGIVYEGYFGFSDIEKKTPVTHETAFYIASMTKPFFSLLALRDEEVGKLDSKWTLDTLFPKLDFKESLRAEHVTVQDLLSHSSGIGNWPLVQATAYTGLHDGSLLDKVIEASYVNDYAPHGTFDYTNVGYNILSHWMDSTHSEDWGTRLRTSILEPLDMHNTSAFISDAKKNNWNLAKGYSVKSDNPLTPVYLSKTDATMHSAGGMISTARDMANFLLMQVNLGKLNGKQVFSEELIKKSQQTLINHDFFGRTQQYGWGWFIRELFDNKLVEHRGGYAGVKTYMSFMPEKKIGLVVLNNQDKWGADLAYAIEDIAYHIALNKPEGELIALMEKNQSRAQTEATHFYANKTVTDKRLTRGLDSDYVGKFIHDTLGIIEVKATRTGNYELRWGNLKSPLFAGENPETLLIEFIPNELENLVFLKSSDKQYYLRYRDYLFTREAR